MSQQGLRQASIRAITGTQNSYEGDWHALFDLNSIPTGDFDGRMLRWINRQLGASYVNLAEAQQAYAVAQGAYNWASLGSIFTPTALGTLLLGYWDAARTDKLTLSGSNVTTWTDVAGNYAAAQSVAASKPVWSATSFNGKPGITFDGSDDELTLASVPFPTGANACEIWALVDQTALAASAGARRIFGYGGETSNDNRFIARDVNSGVNRAFTSAGSGASQIVARNTTVDLSGRHVVRGTFAGSSIGSEVDGVGLATNTVTPATGTTRTRIGAVTAASASAFWQGQIAAILVTSPLSTEQATQLLAYLKSRGGIS